MRTHTRQMILAALFTALTAIGAFIKIPIPPYPIPMTLQTAFIFLSGLLLPAKTAFFSQLAYVLLGLIGIPIFTNGGGFGYLLDPTCGYLFAFLALAPACSVLAQHTLYRGKHALYYIGAGLLIVLLQLCGVLYMALISAVYLHAPLPFARAVYLVYIFIPLDIVKLIVATALATQLRKRLPRYFKAPAPLS